MMIHHWMPILGNLSLGQFDKQNVKSTTSDSKFPKVTKHQRHPTTNIILAPNTFGQNGVRPKIRWLLLRTKSMGPANLTHNHICPANISQQCPKLDKRQILKPGFRISPHILV